MTPPGDSEWESEVETALLVVGATGHGLLARLVTGSLHLGVVEDADCSVVLAERFTKRGLFRRLF